MVAVLFHWCKLGLSVLRKECNICTGCISTLDFLIRIEQHLHCEWKSPGPQSGFSCVILLVGYFSFQDVFAFDPPTSLSASLVR